MPPSLDDTSDIVMYPVDTNPDNSIVVARAILDYEILRLSPECDISWVKFGPGHRNTLIDGAVIGGFQNGRPLYVARKGNKHTGGHAYKYAPGYYDVIDKVGVVIYGRNVMPYTEMEILVVHG